MSGLECKERERVRERERERERERKRKKQGICCIDRPTVLILSVV
ncbi:hypothetical protein [Cylindrospermopsis raciborskii]|nr:hypothetical protein [Cylindrospermopsis raciborskii]MCZ2207909.1 hypothetical protein [Cylindrospermopsis raciborskii PAMP2011]